MKLFMDRERGKETDRGRERKRMGLRKREKESLIGRDKGKKRYKSINARKSSGRKGERERCEMHRC